MLHCGIEFSIATGPTWETRVLLRQGRALLTQGLHGIPLKDD